MDRQREWGAGVATPKNSITFYADLITESHVMRFFDLMMARPRRVHFSSRALAVSRVRLRGVEDEDAPHPARAQIRRASTARGGRHVERARVDATLRRLISARSRSCRARYLARRATARDDARGRVRDRVHVVLARVLLLLPRRMRGPTPPPPRARRAAGAAPRWGPNSRDDDDDELQARPEPAERQTPSRAASPHLDAAGVHVERDP